MMSRFIPQPSAAALLVLLAGCQTATTGGASGEVAASPPNSLTAAETAAGWQLLFDGRSAEGWHVYGGKTAEGWLVENGTLRGTAGSGDLVSDQEFENFELSFDWKLDPGGNSGLFYRVVEDPERHPKPGLTGPEYQLIDDEGWRTPLADWQTTGANYAIHPPLSRPARPIGEWNSSRIVVDGSRVEHWLNGVRVVAYEMWSDDWARRLEQSKYRVRTDYGRAVRGRIVLQDHGGKARFRNIKIVRR